MNLDLTIWNIAIWDLMGNLIITVFWGEEIERNYIAEEFKIQM